MDALEVPKAGSKMYYLLVSYLLYHMLICNIVNLKGWGLLLCGSLFMKLFLLPLLPTSSSWNQTPRFLYLLHSKNHLLSGWWHVFEVENPPGNPLCSAGNVSLRSYTYRSGHFLHIRPVNYLVISASCQACHIENSSHFINRKPRFREVKSHLRLLSTVDC